MIEDKESDNESLSRTRVCLISRNLVISGHRTSVRLEDEIWAALKDVAERGGYTVHELASRIHRLKKSGQSFTSAIRVFLMLYYRNAATRAEQRIHGRAAGGLIDSHAGANELR